MRTPSPRPPSARTGSPAVSAASSAAAAVSAAAAREGRVSEARGSESVEADAAAKGEPWASQSVAWRASKAQREQEASCALGGGEGEDVHARIE